MHRLAEFSRISRLVKIQAHRSREQALREDGNLLGCEGKDVADRAAKAGLPRVADADSARYSSQFRSRVRRQSARLEEARQTEARAAGWHRPGTSSGG